MERAQSMLKRIEAALEPLLTHSGYDLVLVEFNSKSKILRLYIDHPEGVTLERCSAVSQVVSDLLDAEELVDTTDGSMGSYTLEVSSPGLDRPLCRPEHFQRFVGQQVKLTARAPLTGNGRRKVVGVLTSANHVEIGMTVDGQHYQIDYQQIEKARLVPLL